MKKKTTQSFIALWLLSFIAISPYAFAQFSFTQPVGSPFTIGGSATGGKQLAVNDYNSDGYPDIIITNEAGTSDRAVLKLGIGTGVFGTPNGLYPIGGSFEAQAVITEDFDQDGFLDMIVTDNTVTPRAIRYFKGNAFSPLGSIFSNTVSFSNDLSRASPSFSPNSGAEHLIATDFNDDGFLDLASLANDGTSFFVVVILNNLTASPFDGTATKVHTSYGTSLTAGAQQLATGFFDADDIVDLILIDNTNLYLMPGLGTGAFGTLSTIHTSTGTLQYLLVDDFNNDGEEDIALMIRNVSSTDRISFFPGNGDGTFGSVVNKDISGIDQIVHMTLGDLNNDSKNDVVVVSQGASQIHILENTSNASISFSLFSPSSLTVVNFFPVWAAVEDFNADGRMDIIAIKGSGDEGRVFLNTTNVPAASLESWAVNFDGNSLQYGSTDTPALNYPTASSKDNFTIECWVKAVGSATTDQVVIYNGNKDNMQGYGLFIPQSTNEFNIFVNGNIGSPLFTTGATFVNNEWNHIAFGRIGATWFMYKNGKAISGVPNTDFDFTGPNLKTFFGEDGTGNNYFSGSLSECRFWRSAISLANIREWMDVSLSAKHPNIPQLRSYFDFNEGSGDVSYNAAKLYNPNGSDIDVAFPSGITWTDDIPSFGNKGIGQDIDVTVTPNDVNLLNTTGVKFDFGTTNPGGSIVVSRLLSKPKDTENLPGFKSNISWVVRNYGPNTTFSPIDECEIDIKAFQFGFIGTIGTAPYDNAADFRLYKRKSNSTDNNVNPGYRPDTLTYPNGWVYMENGTGFGSIRFGNAGSPGTGIEDFSEFVIVFMGSPLPVTLQAFEGKRIEAEKVLLRWQVAQEINCKGFEIEKSYDVKEFFRIGYQEGRGNSSIVHVYEFTDTEAEEPAYYRLKIIGTDGKSEYSEIVYVGKKGQETKLMLFPNPVTDRIEIQMSKRFAYFSKMRMVVTNAQGKVMFELEDKLLDLQVKLNEQLPKWASGMYIMTIFDEQGAHSAKFIKK